VLQRSEKYELQSERTPIDQGNWEVIKIEKEYMCCLDG